MHGKKMLTKVPSSDTHAYPGFRRPPTAKERSLPHPPAYPHPFQWQPFSIGILASICVQAMRYPVYEGLEIAADAVSASSRFPGFGGGRSRTISMFTGLLYVQHVDECTSRRS